MSVPLLCTQIVPALGFVAGTLGAIRPPYRPFIDPLDVHGYWWAMLLPMAIGIALVYKAVRVRDLSRYWREVLVMTGEIIVGMVLLAAASYLLVEVYARWMAEQAAR